MTGITVIVPVYNERESVRETLQLLGRVLDTTGLAGEIIAVDDGSTDGTRDILKKEPWGSRCTVLTHDRNKGYGAALKTGIRASRYNVICIADCDGTYPLEKLPELAAPLLADQSDMVVGARVGKDVHIPLVRRPAKWLIQCLANYLSGEKIPDLNSGFRAIKKEALIRFLGVLPDGFSFTTTITIALLTNDYRVRYLPISYRKRQGRSKIRPVYDTVNFVKLVIRTVLYFHPFKIFLPASAILFFAGIGIGAYTYFFAAHPAANITAMLVLAAFQIFAIGLIADMIDKRMR
ncbi:MAG: glycosyltransferase family 2 protein [Candidatus Omnitrophica bacterium]|nr:glycosyltransferase family 2 protein [Candidatus Omnitrophota bacterium]